MRYQNLALGFALLCFAAMPSYSQSKRCPAGESGCTVENSGERIRDRVNEGTRKVISGNTESGRVKEVGKTLRDCINCGMDAVRDGVDRSSGKKK